MVTVKLVVEIDGKALYVGRYDCSPTSKELVEHIKLLVDEFEPVSDVVANDAKNILI